jgi:hypothetical protein
MNRLTARGYDSVSYEQNMNMYGINVLARKRTGSYARFVMGASEFTNWMRGDGGKHLASIQELHWGSTGDTEQSLKDELDIETEFDVDARNRVEVVQAAIASRLEGFIGRPDTDATRAAMAAAVRDETMRLSDEMRIDATVRLDIAPSYIPLTLAVPGQEVTVARMTPTHLMSFMNGAGREVAYIDQEGNYVKVGEQPPAPPPPAPEPIVPPDVSGRIIDLE